MPGAVGADIFVGGVVELSPFVTDGGGFDPFCGPKSFLDSPKTPGPKSGFFQSHRFLLCLIQPGCRERHSKNDSQPQEISVHWVIEYPNREFVSSLFEPPPGTPFSKTC